MRLLRRAAGGLLAALTVAACTATAPPPNAEPQPAQAKGAKAAEPEPAVALHVVKWPELEKAIAAHKGKVVVLDVWAEY
jgi:hypothetical protein